MSNKPIVLGIGPLMGKTAWEKLGEHAELKLYESPKGPGTREDFLSKLEAGFFGDVFAVFRSNESTRSTGPFDAEVIAKLPRSVKYICHCGAGYDNIDVAACTARGISVSNAPHTNQEAVADQAIFLMIGALRHAHKNYVALREGKWRTSMEMGHDPENKVLGIIGMGAIGQEIAKRALAFDMKVIYHNRHAVDKVLEQSLHTREVDMDELLATSDVINLSLAYTPETYHILDKAAFAKMKKGVTIVNTARGKMIDEEALIAAMDDGTVWSAGLDVFVEEPAIHSKLLADPRVFLTPHMAAGTVETYLKMEGLAMQNVEEALTKGRLKTQVHEQLH